MENMNRKVEQMTHRNAKRRLWKRAVAIPAAIVVFVTTYALILPAIAMERDTYCGLEAHTHGEECYTAQLVCGYEEGQVLQSAQTVTELACSASTHQHTEECYDEAGNVICGYADYMVHEHDAACYAADGTLVCPLPEVKAHTHDENCYVTETVNVCGMSESAGHVHTADCYSLVSHPELVCGMSESAGHMHTADCYTTTERTYLACGLEESAGHVHTEACYDEAGELTCTEPESVGHTHTEACWATETVTELTCGRSESLGHTHTDACWANVETLELTCGQPESAGHTHTDACFAEQPRLVCPLPEVIPHVHTDECYTVTEQEDGTELRELTCDMTVVETHQHDAACFATYEQTAAVTHHHTDLCYINVLTCTLPEHEHVDECYVEPEPEATEVPEATAEPAEAVEEPAEPETSAEPAADETPAEPEPAEEPAYICGKEEHAHNEACYDENGELVCQLEEHAHDETCVAVGITGDVEIIEDEIADIPAEEVEIVEDEIPHFEMPILVCGLAEHEHSTNCMDENMVYACGVAPHTHTGECYAIPGLGISPELTCTLHEHAHSEACYNEAGELSCGQEEHLHDVGCFTLPEGVEDPAEGGGDESEAVEARLICPIAEHTHSEVCYDENGELICGMEEHTHDQSCYVVPMALVCGLEAHTHDESCLDENGARVCLKEEHEHTANCYLPLSQIDPARLQGEKVLVCGKHEHFHTELCYDEAGELVCGMEEHIHEESCYAQPVTPQQTSQSYRDGEIAVEIFYNETAGIPNGAELRVTRLEKPADETDGEDGMEFHFSEEDGEQVITRRVSVLYDIGLYLDGAEIEPNPGSQVNVRMTFLSGQFRDAEDLDVTHYAADGVKDVALLGDALSRDEMGNVTIQFVTDSFSPFAFEMDENEAAPTGAAQDLDNADNAEPAEDENNGSGEPAPINNSALGTFSISADENWQEVPNTETMLDWINDAMAAGKEYLYLKLKPGSSYDLANSDYNHNNKWDGTSHHICIKDVTNKNVNNFHLIIDLNGGTLQDTDGGKIIELSEASCSVDIIDSQYKSDVAGTTLDYKTTNIDGQGENEFHVDIPAMKGSIKDGVTSNTNNAIKVTAGTLTIRDGGAIAGCTNSAILAEGSNAKVVLADGGFLCNNTAANGGAIRVTGGAQFEMTGGYIYGNTATNSGGAVYVEGTASVATFSNGYVFNNTSTAYNGGAACIRDTGGTVKVEGNVVIANNKAPSGGAINAYPNGVIEMNGGYITGNQATGTGNDQGGGIWVSDKGTLNLHNGQIVFNEAKRASGGIGAYGTINMYGGCVSYNKVTYKYGQSGVENNWCDGGGIGIGNDLTIYDGNRVGAANTLNITGGYITHNSAEMGGGIYIIEGKANISGCTIDSNISDAPLKRGGGGGGICTYHTTINIGGGTVVTNNVSEHKEGGGMIFCDRSTAVIDPSFGGTPGDIFIERNKTYNDEDWGGGGIMVAQTSTCIIKEAYITENDADGYGGGVAGCSTGTVLASNVYDDGAAIFDNTAKGEHLSGKSSGKQHDHDAQKDPVFTRPGNYFQDVFCALNAMIDPQMLGGGYENWTGTVDGVPYTNVKDEILVSSSMLGLTASPTQADKKAALGKAHVYIRYNHSNTHGGGILCNGVLSLGTPESTVIYPTVQLQTWKAYNGSDAENSGQKENQFTFTVYEAAAANGTTGKWEPGRVLGGGHNQLVKDGDNMRWAVLSDRILFGEDWLTDAGGNLLPDKLIRLCIKENPAPGVQVDGRVYWIDFKLTQKTTEIGEVTLTWYEVDKGTVKAWYQDANGSDWPVGESGLRDADNTEAHTFLIWFTDEKWKGYSNTDKNDVIIRVDKKWENNDGSEYTPPDGTKVTVSLERRLAGVSDENEWDEWKPVENTEIELPYNDEWSYTWSKQAAREGTREYQYRVVEKSDDYTPTYEELPKEENGTYVYTITNVPKLYRFDLNKIDAAGGKLTGAQFQLFADESDETPLKFTKGTVEVDGEYAVYYTYDPDGTYDTLVTDDDGTFRVRELPPGTYVLRETKAPDTALVEVPDLTFTFKDGKLKIDKPEEAEAGGWILPEDETDDDYTFSLTAVDTEETYELPETGGMGTMVFTLGGIALLALAGAAFCAGKRRSRG